MAKGPAILTEDFEDYSASLDWRWRRALALNADKRIPKHGFDDAFVIRVFRFIKAFEETTTVSERQELRMKYPIEQRAYHYYLNGRMERYKIEALCLCQDLGQKEVANLLDEDPKVVDFYERVFFDIRKHTPSGLFNKIFAPGALENALGSNLCDLVWKFIGLTSGYRILNALMNPSKCDDNTSEFFYKMGRNNVIKNFGLASLVQPIRTTFDISQVTETMLRIVELDIKEREASGSALPETQQTILRRCIEAVNVQVVDPDLKIEDRHEPTVDQILLAHDPLPAPIAVDVY